MSAFRVHSLLRIRSANPFRFALLRKSPRNASECCRPSSPLSPLYFKPTNARQIGKKRTPSVPLLSAINLLNKRPRKTEKNKKYYRLSSFLSAADLSNPHSKKPAARFNGYTTRSSLSIIHSLIFPNRHKLADVL
jgi:hypothetical protein